MGRHTDPAAVTRRATVLTLTVSALLVAGGIAILKSSGGIGSPAQTPPATATVPPSIDESSTPEPTSRPSATTQPSPTTSTSRPQVTPAGATAQSPRPTSRPSVAAPVPVVERGPKKPRGTGPGSARLAEQVVTLVNAEREKVGCRPVATNAALQRAAEAHSADMAENDYLSHTDQDGNSFADRIRAAGYPGGPLAENIAAGQSTARAVMKSWMGSAAHRATILNCRLTAIGVGQASGGSYGSYWTQDLGG